MYALSNVFIWEEPPEPYEGEKYVFSFTLIFASKEWRFYNLVEADHKNWIIKLKTAIGY